MDTVPFVRRLQLRNFKSIRACDVALQPLTFLVGRNGAGKSNVLDAIHFVSDALTDSLDSALNKRGGVNEVRRRSSGHPTHFVIGLELTLPDGRACNYAFRVGSVSGGGYVVQEEACRISDAGGGPLFRVREGKLQEASEVTFPAVTPDRLALVAASGMTAFRPVFEALTAMGFYNFSPARMRALQQPQDGRLLKSQGENIASVIGNLESLSDGRMDRVQTYLRLIAPMVHGVSRKTLGPMETLEFRQEMAGAKHPWRFLAQNMSDGTLRALGVLVSLMQGGATGRPLLVGIEEPETALHPAAGAALREVLTHASADMQVIVTSHSPDLLDDETINPEAILAVVSRGGDTQLAPLSSAAKQTLRDHLFSAGELLRLEQLEPDDDDIRAQQHAALTGDLFVTPAI